MKQEGTQREPIGDHKRLLETTGNYRKLQETTIRFQKKRVDMKKKGTQRTNRRPSETIRDYRKLQETTGNYRRPKEVFLNTGSICQKLLHGCGKVLTKFMTIMSG